MHSATKKGASLFFILLGLIPLLLVLSFELKQKAIWHRMRQKLESTHLQTLIIPESKVTWMDDHEIRVNGNMFDIHSFILKKGMYTFTGLYDEEETRLMEERDETNKNEGENKLLVHFFKWLQSAYRDRDEDINIIQHVKSRFHFDKSAFLVDLYHKVLTPPPVIFLISIFWDS